MSSGPSATAVLVCQGRAAADGRIAVGRFSDPVAYDLLRPVERTVVDRIRAATPPAGWTARLEYELIRGSAAMMAARTVAVDDAVRERRTGQLVLLGAGLDARAWRMAGLAATTVYEVDRPAPARDKAQRLAGRRPVAAAVVPVEVGDDFADLADALAHAGHEPGQPTTWVWEGVVPYLHEDAVRATLAQVATCSGPGSRLVVNYQEQSVRAHVMRLAVRGAYLAGGRRSPWATEPWRSTWRAEQMAQALQDAGFGVVRDDRVLAVAETLGIDLDRRGDYGRVVVADR